MAKKESVSEAKIVELLRDLLITELGRAGVKQTEIRDIVGCDMGRVNRIVKHLKKERGRNGA